MSYPTAGEVQSEHQHEPNSGSCAGEMENNKEIAEFCGNDLNVPLVDVDKVHCIIRNIIRD